MKKIHPLLLILLLVTVYQGSAQSFKKGFIINSVNDTLPGYIGEDTDDVLVKALFFSTDGTKLKAVKYNTTDLKGFGFANGRVFEKFQLKDFNGKDTVLRTVFAKRMLVGKINTYLIESDQKGDEWILQNKKTGNKVHLKKPQEPIEKIVDGKTFMLEDYKYLQYLTVIKKDSSTTFIKQENIPYKKKEVLRNIKEYNAIAAAAYPVSEYEVQKQVSYGVLGGYPVFRGFVINEPVYSSYRVSAFRETSFIERTLKISFMQSISYSEYTKNKNNPKDKNQLFGVFPIGLKLHSKPMVVMPYFYACLGIQLWVVPIHYVGEERIEKEILPMLGINMGTGAKIKLNNHWSVLAEITGKVTEGVFVNAGVCYQFIK